MKKILLTLFILLFNQVNAQIIEFPDVVFKNKLVASTTTNSIARDINGNPIKVDVNNNGLIEVAEVIPVYELRTSVSLFSSNISDFTGISNFENLRLFSAINNGVTFTIPFIDLSGLLNLEYIKCDNNNIQSLIVNNLPSLKVLYCYENEIQQLNVQESLQLEILDCGNNNITNLNLNGLINLQELKCNNNQLSSIDISGLTSLTTIWCNYNFIQSLAISNLENLSVVFCGNNQISTLSMVNLPSLTNLRCQDNNISNIELLGLPVLSNFYCYNNNITSLDLSQASDVGLLWCWNNQISSIDVSNLSKLFWLDIGENFLTSLDLNSLSFLNKIDCSNNTLTSLYIKDIAYNNESNHFLAFSNNPNIEFICTNENKIPLVQNIVNGYGYTNCVVDASCTLSSSNFDTEPEITLYPNPTKTTLNITSKSEISSLAIYNTLGQLVLNFSNKSITSIDVSSLKSGNYFLKINSATGTKTERFIKE